MASVEQRRLVQVVADIDKAVETAYQDMSTTQICRIFLSSLFRAATGIPRRTVLRNFITVGAEAITRED